MSIGTRRLRMVLQQGQNDADSGGGAVLAWVDVATLWVAMKPVAMREAVSGQKPVGSITHRIEMRYEAGLSPDASMRFVYGARIFNIRGARNVDERNRVWLIDVEEGVAV